MKNIVFIDTEISTQNNTLLDIGAVKADNSKFHSKSQNDFAGFISGADYICGHNIFAHDLNYIQHLISNKKEISIIDTLHLSALLFPAKPYHALVKDDKLQSEELNNPLNDAIKTMDLFNAEINAFERLKPNIKAIYFSLLHLQPQFSGFFKYIGYSSNIIDIEALIKTEFHGKICAGAPLKQMIQRRPVELSYCLALIFTDDRYSLTPPWVYKNYMVIGNLVKLLRNTPCAEICEYCGSFLDIHRRLKSIFGYDSFRTYNGEPLQEKAASAAVNNRSLLAIFPTGGGKSITFQLPALIAGELSRGLTVVISPLQSLMKDQVDNLAELGVTDAVAVNGLLSVIEKAEALELVENGLASILYISPEQLRSKTIERLLLMRDVVRFVIDEAHCFSSWGQDFRVDYLYIGDFIKSLQETKNLNTSIPISCFTATAKQKVISDIREYFKQKLDVELDLYTTDATRSNLRYEVLYKEENEKYTALRDLISAKDCPSIIYVSRTKRTHEIADKLNDDGFFARPFNGKMDPGEKVANQEAFMAGEVKIIVATSAFGMGVDKKDVGLVVHYDISDSLENYVQEAGRAGRDQSLQADCYVLFNDNDLNKHFILLNQSKLSMSEIGQVWRAIKDLTKTRRTIRLSALEIARQAGWDDNVLDIETRVKTAVSALETAGYIKRGMNSPRIYATGILAATMAEASARINESHRFDDTQKQNASRILGRLISNRSVAKAGNDAAESRVDYISDALGIPKEDVISSINLMREEKLLADSKDLTAYIRRTETQNKSLMILKKYAQSEEFLIPAVINGDSYINYKELNSLAEKDGIKGSSVKIIKTLIYYWAIRGYIKKSINASESYIELSPVISAETLKIKYKKRVGLAQFIVGHLYEKSLETNEPVEHDKEEALVEFSVLELKDAYIGESLGNDASIGDVEDALLYLSKIGALSIEGGFLVLYNAMEIKRLEQNTRIQYNKEKYKQLDEYYKQKIQQIHIVGEYANMMVRDYDEALRFVADYFQMDYKQFVSKYFKGGRIHEINRNITPEQYKKFFGDLSGSQKEIIDDDESKLIVVAAGPGSGKTRVLVHKLAALYQLEDVKHEQLLMLTFSRAAATEFKNRLLELIGNAAHFIEIKTFHSYCFDLLGKIGSPENFDGAVKNAVEMIKRGEVETGRITKTVVVIDEAQDMDENEFELIGALMKKNEDMKIIAVGDDDQNIYEFRGSSSKYLKSFILENNAKKYDLLENYRSKLSIVGLANAFSATISNRLKNKPILAVRQENGIVRLIKHASKNLEIPLANNIKNTFKGGTACVLTNTNDEALRVMGLLLNEGIPSKLIQSNDGFNLYNLAELRHFIKYLDFNIHNESMSAAISDEMWEAAKNQLRISYKDSSCLNHCLGILDVFEKTNRVKYKTDFKIFIKESKYEDFYGVGREEIFVSTIHKAKGREFDSVYMMLSDVGFAADESKRKIYVGLTRAKNELYIHCNNNCFDNLGSAGIEKSFDNTEYPEAEKIITQLSHTDVYLGFFKDKKDAVLKLQSGTELTVKGDSLYSEEHGKVLVFSKKYREKVSELQAKGYEAYTAKIRFVVAWQGEEDDRESAVILPDVYFRKI